MLDYLGTPSKVLPYRLDTGDLLLYTNNNVASLLGRLFTWSDWDHGTHPFSFLSSSSLSLLHFFSSLVAVVIKNNPNDPQQSKKDISSSSSSLSSKEQREGRLWVLEATLQVGVSMCDLDAQLEVVLRGGSEIGLRRLYCPQRYVEEDLARLWTFLKEVDGRPYKRNWLELVR
jgi:hypothetical protein